MAATPQTLSYGTVPAFTIVLCACPQSLRICTCSLLPRTRPSDSQQTGVLVPNLDGHALALRRAAEKRPSTRSLVIPEGPLWPLEDDPTLATQVVAGRPARAEVGHRDARGCQLLRSERQRTRLANHAGWWTMVKRRAATDLRASSLAAGVS